ncbi:KDPG and KHG aldolase [Candidatus Omnitrophus magneticus]|uniref:KDPG and KHG aldolase n=1 Tax=Candidatus Omnitrophus magneticus TaxID=1609969 RepID=A0A0F0CRM5_9BACT|nr:KDPG and KHG aldolase [Candidatus Omnitrophus magneticus]
MIKSFLEFPLMGILRGVEISYIEELVKTLINSGLKVLEITMNTPRAEEIISLAHRAANGRIHVGAGTIVCEKSLTSAINAGAEFIVTPGYFQGVVNSCVQKKVPVFPGAFSPTEVFSAWQSGASMVKLFPAGVFGPKYIKELKGPFNDIKIMAVGGVKKENMREFFNAGASAVAFGTSVFSKELLLKKDFTAIGTMVNEYVKEIKNIIGENN